MSWATPTADDVLSEFTQQEIDQIKKIQGAANLPGILARVVAEIRDYIRSGGYALDATDETTIPLGLHNDAITLARWRLLIALPQAKNLQSDARKEATERAEKKLLLIADQKFSVEPPDASAGTAKIGSWNSENKIIMRTHPVPRPATQFSPQTGKYSNPDATEDKP